MTQPALHLWEAFGVELEYMIVDAVTLDVRPITDKVLYEVAGEYVAEVEMGEISWSNELALHVIELKTNGPASRLEPLVKLFQEQVCRLNTILQPMGAQLLPTAMHPWMDPDRELKLWPHEYNPIYEAYNGIFDCRGHGWANVQSTHLNLPFAGDDEFGRLHAAIRLLMPLLPALAASSPIVDRALTGLADYRMEVYRGNSRPVPSVTADVIPEPVYSRGDYEQKILQRLYRDIAPLDTRGVLRHEWLNSRGAIARFDRNTIEIRVLDVQECPAADLAICAAIVAVLQVLAEERWTSAAQQQSMAVEPLAKLLNATIRTADRTIIDDPLYLAQFGASATRVSARDLWRYLMEQVGGWPAHNALETILREGPLATRIERAIQEDGSPMESVYRDLCDCLAQGRMFTRERLTF